MAGQSRLREMAKKMSWIMWSLVWDASIRQDASLLLFRKRNQARLNCVELFGFALDEFHCAPPAANEFVQVFTVDQVEPLFRA